MKRFREIKIILIEKSKEEILKFYHILWTAAFGCGLYSGIISLPVFKESAYFHNILIIFMFFSLFGSFYFFMKKERMKSDKNAILILTVIPMTIFFICGSMISGYSRNYLSAGAEDDSLSNMTMIEVRGRVASHSKSLYGNTYFDMAVRKSEYPKAHKDKRLLSGEKDYMASIIVRGHDGVSIKRDDILKVRGELSISEGEIIIKANSSNINLLDREGPYDMVFGFRQRIYRCIERTFIYNLEYRYAPLARGLILGDRTGISDHQYDSFKKSGTAHLIAISGMHISFLALIIYLILGKIVNKHLSVAFIIIILIIYNFLLDPMASVMRATIWVLSAIIAGSWEREQGSSRILCLSFIMMPIIDPSFIEMAGFWLSFSAMAGVVFVYPVMINILKIAKVPDRMANNYFTGIVILTFSIQIICGPLLLYYFKNLPMISPISNLFILPFFYILIFLLFLAASVSIIWPPAAGVILKLTPFFFRAVLKITVIFSDPVFPAIEIEDISIQQISLYYFIVFIILLSINILLKRFDF